jgi:phosphopantetheinyl transferase
VFTAPRAAANELATPPGDGDVHVWLIELDATPPVAIGELLSGAERAAAVRLRFADDRRRYARAHGALRVILGRYLSRPPGALALAPDGVGKPRLRGGRLRFNLARSGERALLAVGSGVELGVDIERIRRLEDLDAFARSALSERERAFLVERERAFPGAREEPRELLRLWTRKEALLKATGAGLRIAPSAVDVLDPEALPGWRAVDLVAEEGYAAAIAVGAGVKRIVPARFGWATRPSVAHFGAPVSFSYG